MKSEIKKFLEFNGKTIHFLDVDGEYWVAIKPICEALNIHFNKQLERIKSDEILSQLYTIWDIVAADNRLRKMACLPEKFIYGWLFSIQSKSPELMQYKRECYEVLFNYFHGTITQRKHILRRKSEIKMEMHQLRENLAVSEDFHRLMELTSEEMRLGKSLKELDAEIVKDQLSLFKSES